ncbi:MAG: ATP-binding protein [Ilumatobacteraceae bacterium]
MSSRGDDTPTWLSSSPRGDMADVELLHLLAEFCGFDGVAMVVVGGVSPKIRASWPTNRAGSTCQDSKKAERSRLLISAGGSGKNVLTAAAVIDTGLSVRVHASRITPHDFPVESLERAMETLARMFALQIDAESGRRRLDEVNNRLTGLVDLSLALGQELSLSDLLHRIAESAQQMLGARYAALGVLEEIGVGLGQIVTAGLSPEEQMAIGGLPQGHGILGSLMRDTQVVRLEHLANDPRSVGYPPHHPTMDSFLGVPIVIHGVILGSLYLTDKANGPFTAEDEQVAIAFALQAAVAIESVRLFAAEHQRSVMLECVHEISNAIHATTNTQQALDVMCAMVGRKLSVDRVIAKVGDSEQKLLLGAQWHHQSVANLPDDLVPYIGPLAEELWRSNNRLAIDDFLVPETKFRREQIFHGYSDARAVVIVPIGIRERVIGVVYVITVGHPRKWTESELDVVHQIAAVIARRIEDAEYRTNQSEHIERLERLERMQSDFVATVSHELRTPLTSITGYLELLKDGFVGKLTKDQRQMLEVMDRNSNRLRALIENLLVINRSKGDVTEFDDVGVSMSELITASCQELSLVAKNGMVRLDVDSGPQNATVQGAKEQIKSVIINIVSNAIKFSRPGGVVSVKCALDLGAGRVRFSCEDHGIGIPDDDQKQLFERFYRASNATHQLIPGTGLGLSIVKQIVQDHGGHVRLASVEGQGTTVVVDLPLSIRRD